MEVYRSNLVVPSPKLLPITKTAPYAPLVLYSALLPNVRAGDAVVAYGDCELTTSWNVDIGVTTWLALGASPTDTGLSLGCLDFPNGENTTLDIHHKRGPRSCPWQAGRDYGDLYLNYVAMAYSTAYGTASLPAGSQLLIEDQNPLYQGFNRSGGFVGATVFRRCQSPCSSSSPGPSGS